MEKAEKARVQVNSLLSPRQERNATAVDVLACDQSSLSHVREFASQLRQLLQPKNMHFMSSGLDVLCLNAAMMAPTDAHSQFTEDQFEVTFQTNHLAPFLIVNLVHSLMNSGGRIIFTTSGLHSYVSFNDFRGLSSHGSKRFDMIDGNPFQYKAAYSLSKLSNTTCCVALNRKLEELRGRRDVVVNCFTPGLIPSTGLFQHSSDPRCLLATIGSTLEHGGGALAWMATSDEAGQEGGLFYQTQPGTSHEPPSYGTKRFCPSQIPDDASCVSNQELLWKISAELVGIEPILKGAPGPNRGLHAVG